MDHFNKLISPLASHDWEPKAGELILGKFKGEVLLGIILKDYKEVDTTSKKPWIYPMFDGGFGMVINTQPVDSVKIVQHIIPVSAIPQLKEPYK